MTSRTWRLVMFLGVAVVVGGLDLWTKDWAETSLARVEHPLPLAVTGADAGKTLSEFLAGSAFPAADPKSLALLSPPLAVAADAKFPVGRVTADKGYYLFLDPERREAPLLLPNPAMKEIQEKGEKAFSLEQWKADWRAKEVTWVRLIVDEFPFLSEEDAGAVLSGQRLHPIPSGPAVRHAGTEKVQAGQVWLVTERQIDLIPGLLRFVYAENKGAAWGVLGNAPLLVRKIVLQLVSVIAMALILVLGFRMQRDQFVPLLALAMIMGGALGNFVGRFGKHYVVDFIDMYLKDSHWPTYNVADIGITVGVGILALLMAMKKKVF